MSYNDDKRELLKLKQGLIEKSDLIPENEGGVADKAHYEVKGFKNKLVNFMYHYKWALVFGIFFAAVLAFLIITTVTREKGDIRILAFSGNSETATSLVYKSDDFSFAFTQYTEDFDENGYVHVEMYNINLSEGQDYNYYYTNQTKLFSEVSLGEAQIFIADREILQSILGEQKPEQAFEDLSELYPDDPHIVDRFYYQIKGTKLAEEAMYVESCPDDLYIVIRKAGFDGMNGYTEKMAERHRRAMIVFDNIVKNNKVTDPLKK